MQQNDAKTAHGASKVIIEMFLILLLISVIGKRLENRQKSKYSSFLQIQMGRTSTNDGSKWEMGGGMQIGHMPTSAAWKQLCEKPDSIRLTVSLSCLQTLTPIPCCLFCDASPLWTHITFRVWTPTWPNHRQKTCSLETNFACSDSSPASCYLCVADELLNPF